MNFWVARDKDETLVFFYNKPRRAVDFWEDTDEFGYFEIGDQQCEPLFTEITWESEPVEFTLTKKETQL